MDETVCPACGGQVVTRGSQLIRLPGYPERRHVDYTCVDPACGGTLRETEPVRVADHPLPVTP